MSTTSFSMFQEHRPPDFTGIEERSPFIVHSISVKKSITNLIVTEDQSVDCKRGISDDRICFANTFYTSLAAESFFGIKPIKHIVNYNIWNVDDHGFSSFKRVKQITMINVREIPDDCESVEFSSLLVRIRELIRHLWETNPEICSGSTSDHNVTHDQIGQVSLSDQRVPDDSEDHECNYH